LPKIKENSIKNKINNYNSIDINSKAKKVISSLNEEDYKLKQKNNNLSKIDKDTSSKIILFKAIINNNILFEPI
jgi:hypothetical protein